MLKTQQRFKNEKHNFFTEEINKISFNFLMIWHDCYNVLKRFIVFLLMGFTVTFLLFIQLGELYMIHHGWDLFYDIYNTINEHNQR